jgi:hypothetical protein
MTAVTLPSFNGWREHGVAVRPSVVQPMADPVPWNTQRVGPISDAPCRAVDGNHTSRPLVARLFAGGGPLAVAGLVVPVVVDPVDRVVPHDLTVQASARLGRTAAQVLAPCFDGVVAVALAGPLHERARPNRAGHKQAPKSLTDDVDPHRPALLPGGRQLGTAVAFAEPKRLLFFAAVESKNYKTPDTAPNRVDSHSGSLPERWM